MIIDGVDIGSVSKTRIYQSYRNMISRCHYKKDKKYIYYGGKGITVCDEWKSKKMGFISFYKWAMSNGYNDELTLDRIDNDKGYSPDNCRWATWEEQRKNKRDRKKISEQRILNNKIRKVVKSMKCTNKSFSKVGNSCCVILTKTMLEQADMKETDNITINIKKDLITIRKQKKEN